MARAALTADEIESFRERAVQAATRMFARVGPSGLSMRGLAAELGVSAMTPYRYFENVEDLFAQVRTAAFRRFADGQQAASGARRPTQRIRSLGAAYVKFAVDEPEAYRIMFELQQAPTDAYPELEQQQRRAFGYLLEAFQDAVDEGALCGDASTLAHLAWAQAHGLVSLHLAGKLIMGRSFEQLCASPFMAAAHRAKPRSTRSRRKT